MLRSACPTARPRVPERVEDRLGDRLDVRVHLPRVEEEQVDVGVRVQLATAVAALGDQGAALVEPREAATGSAWLAFTKRNRTSRSIASVYAATRRARPPRQSCRSRTSARTRARYSRATRPPGDLTARRASEGPWPRGARPAARGERSSAENHTASLRHRSSAGPGSQRSRPAAIGEEPLDAAVHSLGDRRAVRLAASRRPSTGWRQKRGLHEDAGHVRPDEHENGPRLRRGRRRPVARAQMSRRARAGRRARGDRLVHLPDLHQVAEDVAQVGAAAGAA